MQIWLGKKYSLSFYSTSMFLVFSVLFQIFLIFQMGREASHRNCNIIAKFKGCYASIFSFILFNSEIYH